MNRAARNVMIGEVYLMLFDGHGSEQSGWRPGLVFQNNTGNKYSPNIIALPLTSSIKKRNLPTHVFISSKDTGLKKDSIVLCENPERMSKERIGNYIMRMPDKYMSRIAGANLLATSAISYMDQETLLSVWRKASYLNATTS